MKIKMFTLNAFTKTKRGGNPAGVVLNADSLTSKEMQLIAKEVGFSETAFVQKSNKADFKLSFFTPKTEVNLCGHVTIAAFFLMYKKKKISSGTFFQETKAGVLKVTLNKDGLVFMEQNLPKFSKKPDRLKIAQSLNISIQDLNDELPIQIVSTGGKDILIPVRNLKTLLSIRQNIKKVIKLSREYAVDGFCVFCFETKNGSTAHLRSFAPAVGIIEDPACGVQSGALGCYLYRYGHIPKVREKYMRFEQGYAINKPSEVFVKLKYSNRTIRQVNVGGKCSNIKERVITV